MPRDRDPGLQGADILEAPPEARSTPVRRREPPANRGPAPSARQLEPAVELQSPPAEEQEPEKTRGRRWLRWVLFLLLPIVLIVGA
jgi:hypothetical protein